jgi:hypothetical protein
VNRDSRCSSGDPEGVEFLVVFVVGRQQEHVPYSRAISVLHGDMEKEAAMRQEKSLLCIFMTQARERLEITSVDRRSEFLDGLTGG